MLLLVGVSTRAMAESAVRAGYRTVAVDYFGDLDQRLFCRVVGLKTDLNVKRPSAEALFRAARYFSPSGVVYGSPFENHPELVRCWEREGTVVGNGAASLAGVRDLRRLSRALARGEIRMPVTVFSDGASDEGGWGGSTRRGELWLHKPEKSGGGHGVRLLTSPLWPTVGHVLQQFVRGIPGSVTFLADGHRAVVVGTSRQLVGTPVLGARGFRYAGNMVPLALPRRIPAAEVEAKLLRMASILAEEFSLKGLNTVDFIVNEEDVYVLEVNPRWSGSAELLERRAGLPLFHLHVEACRGSLPGVGRLSGVLPLVVGQDEPVWFWAKGILYAPAGGRARALNWQEFGELRQRGVRDIPCPGVEIRAGQPICSVVVAGQGYRRCWRNLLDAIPWVRELLWEPTEGGEVGGRGRDFGHPDHGPHVETGVLECAGQV